MEAMQPDNLATLKDDMVAFIAGHGLRRMPGYVTEEVPTVLFEEEDADGWKDFVEHAKSASAPFITMSEVTLEKSDVAILLEQLRGQLLDKSAARAARMETDEDDDLDLDDAEALVKHVGKTGYLQLGFAHGGVMFLFETSTDWYDRFQDLMETATDLGGLVVDDPDE